MLVAGDSTFLPNGEIYLFNATTGATTALGSPNTPWAPLNHGGMTADGSVIAVTFAGAGVDASRHSYIHNAHGWFHLTSALAARGIDLASDDWDNEQLEVTGMSPDGTLVFGQGWHHGNLEGFVAEFPPGYLSAFDVPSVAPTNTSIVGVWSIGDPPGPGDHPEVAALMADGTFYQMNADGFERGRYTWNASTGSFTLATIQDTGGDTGFSGANGHIGITATVSGDNITLAYGNETQTDSRIGSDPGSIVGGWVLGDPRLHDSSAVMVLLGDGTYLFAIDGTSTVDSSGRDGIEIGTYSWGADGTFVATPGIDTNGQWGLSHLQSLTWQLSADGLQLTGTDGTNSYTFTRIVDPQTVVPVITSALSAKGTIGAPFAYTITATHAASFGATGLPAGLSVDPATGLISGTPAENGTFSVSISASNSFQSTSNATLSLMVMVSDVTGPATSIAAPADGVIYTVGQVVAASYSCTDPSGIAVCAGPVASGALVDTSTVGTFTFTVDATDTVGNVSHASSTYRVSGTMPPSVDFEVLHRFDVTEGANVLGPLVQGTDGRFYGTTFGGTGAVGRVYRIDAAGHFAVLHVSGSVFCVVACR